MLKVDRTKSGRKRTSALECRLLGDERTYLGHGRNFASSHNRTYELESFDPDILSERVSGKPFPRSVFSPKFAAGHASVVWRYEKGGLMGCEVRGFLVLDGGDFRSAFLLHYRCSRVVIRERFG